MDDAVLRVKVENKCKIY